MPDDPAISVLFSEPKIPQFSPDATFPRRFRHFSALQRAENSSIYSPRSIRRRGVWISVLFSEPKIPQFVVVTPASKNRKRFQCSSASRKFLNSSRAVERDKNRNAFQCSSASRKFLNPTARRRRRTAAEFQCSSASRKFLNSAGIG